MAAAARALTRAGLPPTPHLDLPVGLRPQVVGEDNVEIVNEVEDEAEKQEVVDEAVAEEDAQVEEDVEMQDADAEDEGDASAVDLAPEAEEGEAVEEELPNQPLLSLAESLVLSYSLTQTRQHHLTHLLPHIFSHPPISSYNRPRLKLPPKSTFIFPTPALPDLPLPMDEYHGLSKPDENKELGDGQAGEEEDAKGSSKKTKDKSNHVPAHEGKCIARVDFSIGPISFPGTELWIGRFVSPRASVPKRPPLTKEEKAERDRIRRHKKKMEEEAGLRPKPVPSSGPRGSVGRPPGPGRPPSIRPPGLPGSSGPIAGPGRPPLRPPVRPGPPRPGIDPALIQRVNAAAAQHPWLSVIIHKAARNSASKEELAKLARIVARLGRGEGVGEGPYFGLSSSAAQAAAQPTTAAPTTASTSQPRPPRPPPVRPQAATSTVSSSAQPTTRPPLDSTGSDSSLSPIPSDSDSEPDMTGRKQVGGGSGPEPTESPVIEQSEAQLPSASELQTQQTSSTQPTSLPPPNTDSTPVNPTDPTGSDVPSPAPPHPRPPTSMPSTASAPTGPPTNLPLPPVPVVRPQGGHFGSFQMTPQTPVAPSTSAAASSNQPSAANGAPPHTQSPAPSGPPPPPPRRYPLPAPFLYLAFRELPTEKYLLPIGAQSFISRIGGDHVTHPAPKPPSPAPIPAPIAEPTPEVIVPQEISKRTRQSLGRQHKEEREPTPAPPESVRLPTPTPELPTSGLPPLSGMAPPPGTVLISTFLPTTDWMPPDWKSMSKRLPFENKAYDIEEDSIQNPSSSPDRRKPAKTDRPPMLNLGAEAWYPDDDPVQAVTMRLCGMDDLAWAKMKRVLLEAEHAEVSILAEEEPDLVVQGSPRLPTTQVRLWQAYTDRKRAMFGSLLARVPPRKFLHYRLAETSSDLIEASADRWAPRPYPLSTRPLYLTSPPPEDEPVHWNVPVQVQKKRRNEPEAEVEFEMPVSLDLLDERVALGAKKAVNRKVGKLKMPKPPKVPKHGVEESPSGRFQKRGVPGKICEGCATAGLKVWRRGPGGPATRKS
ncbi:hypothetical protein BD324DRAFT_520673 [Kockovaella imperatae]|uniref:Uncharacterized protein n=1 Tax=Kockovaella imperatae TaxID=4999 RepID=A0A1Y1UEW6_9TREE|nr:hypothetical protein BD324DRAFT_520673 [Kockovaella imperatae]ORX36046.1 hypothetical protein BD324DRAFT_520673 [Kockovaella imperatae]